MILLHVSEKKEFSLHQTADIFTTYDMDGIPVAFDLRARPGGVPSSRPTVGSHHSGRSGYAGQPRLSGWKILVGYESPARSKLSVLSFLLVCR
jgi:hypothetical protein